MALHEQAVGATDEWYTPKYVFDALGCMFDVDVAHPGLQFVDWVPAKEIITSDSLYSDWHGFVWMNPPFGGRNGITPWLDKFFKHKNGIALTPDRTSAPWWQIYASQADAILFVSPKIRFIGRNGELGKSPAQGTTLMAKGKSGVSALEYANKKGLGFLAAAAAAQRIKDEEITRLREENAQLRRLLVEAQDYIDDVYDPLYISIGQELESLNIAAAIREGEGKCR